MRTRSCAVPVCVYVKPQQLPVTPVSFHFFCNYHNIGRQSPQTGRLSILKHVIIWWKVSDRAVNCWETFVSSVPSVPVSRPRFLTFLLSVTSASCLKLWLYAELHFMFYTDGHGGQIPQGPPQGSDLWPFACALCALPVRTCFLTQEFWVPQTTRAGQQESKNYLRFPACLPHGHMCEICCSGMRGGLCGWKAAYSHLATGEEVADTWQTVMLKV